MFRVLLAAILFSSQTVSATPELQNYLLNQDFSTARTRDLNNCGFYLAPKGPGLFYRNSTGYRLGDLSILDLQHELQQMIQMVGIEKIKGTLVLAGLPMWDPGTRQRVTQVRQLLKDMNLKDLYLLPMYTRRANVGWLGQLADALTGFAFLRQDFEVPTPAEVGLMVVFVILEIPAVIYFFAHFEPKVAIPLVTNHAILVTTLSLFRRSVTNWAERSDNRLEKLSKYALTGIVYIVNSNVMSKLPEIQAGIQQPGFWHHAFSAIGQFAKTQTITLAASGAEYYFFIISGVIQDEMELSNNQSTSSQGRNLAALRTGAYYLVNGPIMAIATTSNQQIYPGIPMNLGQVLLITLASGAAVYWRWSKTRKTLKKIKSIPLQPNTTTDDILNQIPDPANDTKLDEAG
jgi:hypothetical protein